MLRILETVSVVCDPRGRCDRKGLLAVVLVVLSIQCMLAALVFGLKLPFDGPLAIVLKLAFLWIALSATIQRLHDMNLSGWWLLAGSLGLIVWAAIVPVATFLMFGPQPFNPAYASFYALFFVIYVPALAATLWLHFAQGNEGPNRFGPAPDETGFSKPAKSQQPGRAGEAAVA